MQLFFTDGLSLNRLRIEKRPVKLLSTDLDSLLNRLMAHLPVHPTGTGPLAEHKATIVSIPPVTSSLLNM
ncbi:MAG: hypothetical protein R3C20_04460 [Planctomycetaceae bacterium]